MAGSRKPAQVRSERDIRRVMRRMTVDQKVGQCMTLAFYGTTIDDKVTERIVKYHAGGLRITPHVNTSGSPDKIRRLAPYLTVGQYAEVLNELQRAAAGRPLGLPLHMVTDQEGDLSVDILHGGMSLFPSQMGLTATGSPATASPRPAATSAPGAVSSAPPRYIQPSRPASRPRAGAPEAAAARSRAR